MKRSPLPRLLITATLGAIFYIVQIHGIAQTAPAASDAAIPVPPMQGKPWTPPETKLPPVVVNATKELFDQGMADPRGCEYREVEIDLGFGMKDKWHAWVLPGEGKTRYAVGWNGREIPVSGVGALVDLRKDFPLEDAGRYYATTSDGLKDRDSIGRSIGIAGGMREYQTGSLSETSLLPIKVALLLRLGEAELAEGAWKQCGIVDADPYLYIAREWLVSWYNSAVGLHMGEKRPLALQTLRRLMSLEKAAEASATRRKLTYPLSPEVEGPMRPMPRETSKFYFEELQNLPELLADEERRAKEPPYTPVLKSGLPAAGPERVAALIRDLELESWSDSNDSIMKALVGQGGDAVEPLIQCLENDNRLTLCPSITLLSYDDGKTSFLPVYMEAWRALEQILQTRQTITLPPGHPGNLSADERKAFAEKFRAYWASYKDMPPQERWFSMLCNDNAPQGDWLQAAENITQRTGKTSYDTPDPSSPMQGEPLRAKVNPSVSDLFVKRFGQLLSAAGGPGRNTNEDSTSKLLFALADWDGKARAGDLNAMVRQFDGKFPDTNGGHDSTRPMDARLYESRLAAGDPTALADYADWLLALQPGEFPKTIFRLMWEHPGDPAIVKVSRKLFSGKKPLLVPHDIAAHGRGQKSGDENVWGRQEDEDVFAGLVNTPMLGIPPFREQVLKALDDIRIVGTAMPFAKGSIAIGQSLYGEYPKAGEREEGASDFRMCDYYASLLAKADIFPEFNVLWPLKRRDAAVAVCKKLLKQYGDAFQFNSEEMNNGDFSSPEIHARAVFPRLDHPATPLDVAQGHAIFSLKGTVRLVPMPVLPLHAERPSRREDMQDYEFELPHGEKQKGSMYLTDGYVLQAEEVLVDGKWQRYYGFAGRHQLEKVPAVEIEFHGGYPWVGITPSLDGALDGPQITKPGAKPSTADHVATSDTPLVMTLKLRNRSDREEQVPDALMFPADAGKALPPGVNLSLSWSWIIPYEASFPTSPAHGDWGFGDFHFNFGEWSDVQLRKEITTATAATPAPRLAAAAEFTLLQFDLRDYFDVSRPGSYRVVATFQVPGEPIVKSQEIIFSVVEKTR